MLVDLIGGGTPPAHISLDAGHVSTGPPAVNVEGRELVRNAVARGTLERAKIGVSLGLQVIKAGVDERGAEVGRSPWSTRGGAEHEGSVCVDTLSVWVCEEEALIPCARLIAREGGVGNGHIGRPTALRLGLG
jgi:hypothetical protein